MVCYQLLGSDELVGDTGPAGRFISAPSSSSSSCSSSDCSDCERASNCDSSLSARELLALAIERRRRIFGRRERDLRRELLHTGLIQTLCRHVGDQARAAGQRRRKRRHRRLRVHGAKRRCDNQFGFGVGEQQTMQMHSVQLPQAKMANFPDGGLVQQEIMGINQWQWESSDDPFGLNELFDEFYGIKGRKIRKLDRSEQVDTSTVS